MFSQTCEKLEFPEKAIRTLTCGLEQIRALSKSADAMRQAEDRFVTTGAEDPSCLLQTVSELTGIPVETVTMITLVNAVTKLRAVYAEKGYPEQLMWDTLIDLRCKLQESYDTDGIWGTGAVSWYQRLFTCKILKLGRLEYEIVGYKWDTPYCGIQKGDPILNIHIPSCGGLPVEAVMDSLKTAHRFFMPEYGPVQTYVCGSWMLYPPMRETVFPDDSNLSKFYDLFEMVETREDPENHNFWRVFNVEYSPDVLEQVPTDTTLRRNLHAFMCAGNNMGVGRGAFRFDGEKMIYSK